VNWKISVLDSTSTEVASVAGANNLSVSFVPAARNYYTIQIQNMDAANPSQKVWIKSTYTAPRSRFTPRPAISQQPTDQFIVAGEIAELNVAATGAPDSFQWARGGFELLNETNSFLRTGMAGNYSVRIWNEAGATTSSTAVVAVYSDATPTIVIFSPPAGFGFQVTERKGLRYEVESSVDLVNWTHEAEGVAPFDFRRDAVEIAQFFRVKRRP
jgi:hypothetical protein